MLTSVEARVYILCTTTDFTVFPSQVKRALPLLLSSMKAYVSLHKDKKKGAAEAQENRCPSLPSSFPPSPSLFSLHPSLLLFPSFH